MVVRLAGKEQGAAFGRWGFLAANARLCKGGEAVTLPR